MKFRKLVGALFTAVLALQMHAGQQGSRGLAGKLKEAAKGVRQAWHRKRNRDIGDAIVKGRVSAVRAFLDDGVDVNSEIGRGFLLHFAVEHGGERRRVDIVRLLIERGADVNRAATECFSDDPQWYAGKWAPLHYAAREGDEQLVRLLIEAGADVNAQDGQGCTPLYRAIVPSRIEGTGPFVLHNPYSWADSEDYKLNLCARPGRESVVKLLLENGALVHTFRGDSSSLHLVLSEWDTARRLQHSSYEFDEAVERARTVFLKRMIHWLVVHGENPQDIQEGLLPPERMNQLAEIYQKRRQEVLQHLQDHFPMDLCSLILDMG